MPPLRSPFGLVLLASAAVVGSALGFQLIGGLQPCELCLYERWPYYAAIVITLAALAIPQPALRRPAMWLVVLLFAASTCLAAYHVAVEQHWIAGPTACTGGLGEAHSPDELLKMLQARQPVQCDVVQWSVFGVSLAGFNLIASLLIFAFSLMSARRGDAA